MTRKAGLCDAERAPCTKAKTRVERREGIALRARHVTCTGHRASCRARVRCGGVGRAASSFRPAPARLPPQRGPTGSSSCALPKRRIADVIGPASTRLRVGPGKKHCLIKSRSGVRAVPVAGISVGAQRPRAVSCRAILIEQCFFPAPTRVPRELELRCPWASRRRRHRSRGTPAARRPSKTLLNQERSVRPLAEPSTGLRADLD